MNMKELRALDGDKLQEELVATKKELFSLKMQNSSGQIIKPHLFNVAKKRIAKIKTILQEKGLK